MVGSTLNVPNYSAGASAVRNVSTFTATSGQTTFTISGGYTVGLIDVFINGARLSTADYTATNSTTVVLGTGAVLNDIVDVVNYTATFTAGITGTGTTNYLTKWTGTSAVNNSIIYDNGTNVGIGTASPTSLLHIRSSASSNVTQKLEHSSTFGAFHIINNASSTLYVGVNNSAGSLFGGSGGVYGGVISMDNAFALGFATSGSERMRILATGNIGIGLIAPTSLLHVYSSASSNVTHRLEQSSTFGAFGIYNNASTTLYVGINNSAGSLFGGTGSAYGGVISMDSAYALGFATSGSERMRISATGNVGIGLTAPTSILHIIGNEIRISNSANVNYYGTLTHDASVTGANIYNSNDTGGHIFQNTGSEKIRITNGGSLLVGTTTNNGRICSTNDNSDWCFNTNQTGGAATKFHIRFLDNGTPVGNITSTGSTTSYNTSSDYRLKEDYKEIKGLEKVLAINVYDFKWKNNEFRMDGVIAHELQDILPYAVSGEKDGKDFQMVDYSKIVPILVKSIQELKAELDQLKAK